MTLAVDPRPLNFAEFLAHYGRDNPYELIDGEVAMRNRGEQMMSFPTFPNWQSTAAAVLGISQ
jgi:hypothetical protein